MLEEGSERRAAFAQLRSAHEIAVETVEKKSLSPFNDKVYAHNSRPLGHWRNLEQLLMLGAYAPPGSAPFDLVMEFLVGPPPLGPAPAAEPLRTGKKRSRALVFSLSGEARRVGGRGCLAAALMAQRPPCDMQRKRTRCLRPSARTSGISSRSSIGSSSAKLCAVWSGSARTEISAGGWTASTILSTESASELGSALKSWSAATEFSASGWRTLADPCASTDEGTASNLVMYVSAADNYVGVTGTFLGTPSQGVWTSRCRGFGAFGGSPGWCSSRRARWTCTACRSGPAPSRESLSCWRAGPHGLGALHGLTAQGNVGCDQLLCNDVNCTDVFTTHVDASGAVSCAALTATGAVAGAALTSTGAVSGSSLRRAAHHRGGPAELSHRNHEPRRASQPPTITGAASAGPLDCESLDCTFTATSGGVSTGSVVCGKARARS